MRVSFSTISQGNAIQNLQHNDFDWLNDKQREYVLANLGDIRVQDPMMYSPACLEIYKNGTEHSQKLADLRSIPSIREATQ